ncbi:metal ABC transporter solute-binding protein, Zn/Mn family [Gemmata obscuriglobus]|uniref:metal ABC transporter solute-binding protein, Zn/Mn family n=1 Tax=Gemmata obscuriglobus TaxID=114 RepID=UPI00030D158E|nr:zinc ABC transporter substrate-binding protein [Gemmata obscuriglobus]
MAATYSILGDLVRNVVGDGAEVVTLVGPDGDARTFDPSPQDGMTIADAAVVFEAEFDGPTATAGRSSCSSARRWTSRRSALRSTLP